MTKSLALMEQAVLDIVTKMNGRSLTTGSVASYAGVTRPQAVRALGRLLVLGYVDEDHGFWRATA